MSEVLAWMHENPLAVLAVVIWVVLNVVPRPHPDDLDGPAKRFWWIVDRLSLLTADALPGRAKMLLRKSTRPASDTRRAESTLDIVHPRRSDDDPLNEETKN